MEKVLETEVVSRTYLEECPGHFDGIQSIKDGKEHVFNKLSF